MSNFALLATDPSGDIISSINYLLATQGQGTGNLDVGNALVANVNSGQITTAADPNYLAYLYQFMDVRYADSADGSVNFSTSPTNRTYFGVRNFANADSYTVDSFISTSTWTAPAGITSIQLLMVGGGGAGGSGGQGGGGGGGAVYYNANVAVTPGTSYTITVGAGGAPSLVAQANGSPTTFSFTSNSTVIYTVLGGGGGGGELAGGAADSVPRNGGSGGGGSHSFFANGVSCFNTGANATAANSIQFSTYGYGLGTPGGQGRGQQNGTYGGITCSDFILIGGGGGGATTPGSNWTYGGNASSVTSLIGGAGGDGYGSSITGTLAYYGGGGGGGLRVENASLGFANYISGPGGLGGGQGGIPRTNGNVAGGGAVNTGGGGAGVFAGPSAATYTGGAGGSGVVYIAYTTAPPSDNPTDYVWTQVSGGGFGTTRFLYYQTNGGRQIQFAIATTPPGGNYTIVVNNQTIDLDILSSTIVSALTSIQNVYSDGQVFNRNASSVWTPNAVGNLVSTTSNVTVIRNNNIIAQVVKTLNFNTSANTWTISNTGPDINPGAFTFANATISSAAGYYQTFVFNDTFANVAGSYQVTTVTAGLQGNAGANGVNGLSISTTYSAGQTFSKFESNGVTYWTPNANVSGYVNTAATTVVYNGNVLVGRITRQLGYDSNSPFAGNISPNVAGNVSNITYVGNIRTPPLTTDYGRTIFSSNIGGYNYYTLLGASFTSNNDTTQYHADYTVVVSGGGTYADIFLVGPGGQGGKNDVQGNPRSDGSGNGGEVKYFPNVYIPAGSYSLTVGGQALSATQPTQVLNTTLTIGGNTYQANVGGFNVGSAGSGAGGASPDGLLGGPGVPDPWGTVNWITDPLIRYTGSPSPGVYYTQGNVYYVDNPSVKQPMYFGGGGAYAVTGSNLNAYYSGGVGGGGSFLPNIGAGTGPQNGVYGGGGSAEGILYTAGTTGGGGVAIIRINSSIANYGNLWILSNSSVTDINSSRFTIGPDYNTTLSYYTPITYSDSNTSTVSSQIDVSVSPATQGAAGSAGSRGFVPLAYILTPSTPAVASNATLSSWFAASRDAITPPIGTGYTPINGDTAQFFWSAGNVSAFKTYDGTGWANVTGQVIDGNVLVSGTVTANKLAANDIYALTIQSTNANVGNVSSNGFWLQANTGNARFAGNTSIGNNLTVGNTATIGSNLIVGTNLTVGNSATIGSNLIVGNNANIGANLFVSGLITTGNLNNNTVNTTTITSNAVSFFTGFQDNADLLTFYPNTSLYSLTNTISVTTTVTNTKVLVSGQVLSVIVANTASVLDDFTSNIGIRMLDGSTGLVYILTNEEKLFTPGVVGNVIQGDHAYYETGIVLTLANVATYSFGVYGKVTGTANIFFTDTLNRRNAVSNLKR